MKKIFLILSLFVSVFGFSQVPLVSTPFPFGWQDVRSFGALNDSSTDNTAAFRACAASFGALGGVMVIPPGKFVINDSVIIPANVTVRGSGGNCTNDSILTTMATTTILCRSATHSVFVTTSNQGKSGVQFRDFAIINQSGSTPTNGSGIVVRNGGDFRMEGITIAGFYIDLNITNAFFYNLQWCYFFNPVFCGVSIGNSFNSDIGDFTIANCQFASGSTFTHPLAGLYWQGSGGLKLMNCKFVFSGGDTSKTFYNSIYLYDIQAAPSDIIISNSSIEGFDSSAIFLNCPGAIQIRHIQITNVQTETFNSAIAPAIRLIGATVGNIANVVVNNISAQSFPLQSASPAIQLTNCTQVSVGEINGVLYSTPIAYTNCFFVHYSMAIPADNLPSVNLWSNGPLNLISDSALQSGGKDPIIFHQGGYTSAGGINSERMRIDSNGRLLVGTGLARETVPGRFELVEVRKDTNTQFASFVVNASSGSGSSAEQGFDNGNFVSFVAMWGPNFAGYKSIAANDVGLYHPSGSVYLQADNGDVKFGNNAGFIADFNAASRFLFGNGATDNATAKMQVTSSTAQLALHFDASHDAIFTVSSTGALTIAPSISGGTITFAGYGSGISTGTPAFNLAVNSAGKVIEVSAGGTPTLQQVFTAGTTLTGNNTIINGTNTTAWSGAGDNMFGSSTVNATALFQIQTSAQPQLALHNDATHFTTFNAQSGGGITITPSNASSGVNIAGNLVIAGTNQSLSFNGDHTGTITLVSGTKTFTVTNSATSSELLITVQTPTGVTTTVGYSASCTSGSCTVTAYTAGGTTNTGDTSILRYVLIN